MGTNVEIWKWRGFLASSLSIKEKTFSRQKSSFPGKLFPNENLRWESLFLKSDRNLRVDYGIDYQRVFFRIFSQLP